MCAIFQTELAQRANRKDVKVGPSLHQVSMFVIVSISDCSDSIVDVSAVSLVICL